MHSIIARYCTSCFIHSSCHCVSPSYISCFIVFLLHLLLVYIKTRHHVMIFTLLHHLSSVLSIPYHSHSFSHLNVLVCLILTTFSYRFLFYSLEILSLILGLFLVSLPSICVPLTYKSLKTGQPYYLRSLLSFPSHCCTRSSSRITLSRPSPPLVLK